jgi:spore maturation protein CgeB
MKVQFFGINQIGTLESSYEMAAKEIKLNYNFFNYELQGYKYIIGNKIGKTIHKFWPVNAWQKKLNRDFIIHCKEYKPELIIVFTNAPLLPSSIACLKVIQPEIKIVLVWPDTLANLDSNILLASSIYDAVFTYSSQSVKVFEKLGFNKVYYLPLAADGNLHLIEKQSTEFEWDIGFVGGWRPEREKVLQFIINNFPNLRIAIHGPIWKQKCKSTNLKTHIKSNGLVGSEMASFFNKTRINMNIIDDTNYPAANMRFFEILIANGLQLVNICPEQKDFFIDQKDLIYFNDFENLKNSIKIILSDEARVKIIRQNGFQKTVLNNLYSHRLLHLISSIKSL